MTKIGRNTPCPCGSGKKYKRCHGFSQANPMPRITYKFSDQGTTDPFTARMMVQIFKIADAIFPNEQERNAFHDVYNPVLQNLREARLASERFVELVSRHEERVNTGVCVQKDAQGNFLITENIDLDASMYYKDVNIRGRIALDNIVQVGRHLGVDLGFIYDEKKKFDDGIRKIAGAGGDPKYLRFVCGMIEEARGMWLENLIANRNTIEHKGFCLPPLTCGISAGIPKLIVQQVKLGDGGQDIREAVSNFWTQLFHFGELLLIFLLVAKMPKGRGLLMIPPRSRDPSCPVAFKVIAELNVQGEGAETWKEYREEAEKAHEEDVAPAACIRITDVNGAQLSLLQIYPNDKGAKIISIDGLPLEIFLLFLKGKQPALEVHGKSGVMQAAQVNGLTEEEFLSWEPRIAQISQGSMIGHIVKDA